MVGNDEAAAKQPQQKQPQQKQPQPPVERIATKAERQRAQALQEVDQVMESLGTTRTQLDNFNLLGVVANPLRGSQHGGGAVLATSPSSAHGSAIGSSHQGSTHNTAGNTSGR